MNCKCVEGLVCLECTNKTRPEPVVTNDTPCTTHGAAPGKNCPCVGKTVKEARK